MFGKNDFDDFDKEFNRVRRWATVVWILTVLLNLGILAFFIWVVIMLMRYFGVI